MKYQLDYPGCFDGEVHGRGWLQTFFGWHNDDHHHSSLALFTPAAVPRPAYGAYPERFTHRVPRVALPPAAVHINPLTADALTVVPVAAAPDETSTKVSSLTGRSKLLAALRRPTLVAAIAT